MYCIGVLLIENGFVAVTTGSISFLLSANNGNIQALFEHRTNFVIIWGTKWKYVSNDYEKMYSNVANTT